MTTIVVFEKTNTKSRFESISNYTMMNNVTQIELLNDLLIITAGDSLLVSDLGEESAICEIDIKDINGYDLELIKEDKSTRYTVYRRGEVVHDEKITLNRRINIYSKGGL